MFAATCEPPLPRVAVIGLSAYATDGRWSWRGVSQTSAPPTRCFAEAKKCLPQRATCWRSPDFAAAPSRAWARHRQVTGPGCWTGWAETALFIATVAGLITPVLRVRSLIVWFNSIQRANGSNPWTRPERSKPCLTPLGLPLPLVTLSPRGCSSCCAGRRTSPGAPLPLHCRRLGRLFLRLARGEHSRQRHVYVRAINLKGRRSLPPCSSG